MIVRGPFSIQWGENTLSEITEIDIELETQTDDYTNNSGKTYELEKGVKIGATITLLASDTEALGLLLPQLFVPTGGTLSNGKLVTSSVGAIDFIPSACDLEMIYNDLKIISCKNERELLVIPDCRTRIDSIEIDNRVRKVKIKFMGEGSAALQMFREDYLILDSGEDFLLDDGQRLIL